MGNFFNIKLFFKRIFIVFLFYQLSRILFYFFNKNLFIATISFGDIVAGMRFDLSAIGYINLLFVILYFLPVKFTANTTYQKVVTILFYLVNLLFLLTNVIDFEYYKFTHRRSTFSLITADGMRNEIAGLLPAYAINYWYVPVTMFIYAILFWVLLPKKYQTEPIKFSLKNVLILILGIGTFFIMGRGGLGQKPLRIVDANLYTNANKSSIVLNTPFCIYKTLSKKEKLENYNYYTQTDLNNIFNPIKESRGGELNKKNVVVLILESFGKENLNRGLTPFLDSLAQESLYFKNSYANGRVSIDAVPSIISSIPSLMNRSLISSSFSVNEIKALPEILTENGYYTAFFHGAFNGSQNFDQYCKVAGFNNYYGKNEYKGQGAFDGKWGIFDEEFLQFFSKKLTSFNQPFFASLFTISSHAPFTIPVKYKNKFPKGSTEIDESIAYTDYSLKQFFATARQLPWYKNTLFIISADHTSAVEKAPEFRSTLGNFQIPIIFFDPSGGIEKGVSEKNIQQIDIYPTILDYLGIKTKFLTYGKSIFSKDNFVVNYSDNTYNYIKDNYYLSFDGKKSLGLYNLDKDPLQKNNLLGKDLNKQKEMEKFIKAYVQSFNERMTNNNLMAK